VSEYTIQRLQDVPDVLGDYPGEMRFFTQPLDCEQVAFTFRRMPAQTGGKGGYGHRHKTQEEIYFVASGTLQFKLDDEILDIGAGTAVRIAPPVVRSVWNEGPEDAELVIVSTKVEDLRAEGEMIEGFWPE
jgi:mannose-6-phosphate isomerase-like protein (cupin superfamily)